MTKYLYFAVLLLILLIPIQHTTASYESINFQYENQQAGILSSFLNLLSPTSHAQVPIESISLIREDCTGYSNCYTSLSAWEAGEQRNLVTSDEIAVARIEGLWTSADTQVRINGWTTDATHYIKIYTTEEARHNGVWDDTKYRLIGDVPFVIRTGFVTVEGLQVEHNGAGEFAGGIMMNQINESDGVVNIGYNIVRQTGAAASMRGLFSVTINAATTINAYNNIIYGWSDRGIRAHDVDATWFIYNNTIHNNPVGIHQSGSATVTAINNVVFNNDDDFLGTMTLDYNASDDGDGTNAITPTSAQWDLIFTSTTPPDFHLLDYTGTNSIIDQGTDLSADANLSFSDDIDGQLRSGAWDIGADEQSGTPPETCTSFTYSTWSPTTCPVSEIQTRTITSSLPSGCLPAQAGTGGNPITSQSCTYTPPPVDPPPTMPSSGCNTDIGNIEVCPKPFPAPTLPPAGGTFIDPTFGTEILRVTDRTHGSTIYHTYSFWNPFNADSTRLTIRSVEQGPQLFSFDPVNFTSSKIGYLWNGISLDSSSINWSSTDPDIFWGLKVWSQLLYQYEPDPQVYTLIKDFTGILPPGNIKFLTKSDDDRWFSFIVGNPDNNNGVMGAYDMQTDTVYQHDFSASHGLINIHSATIDKSGEKVWLNRSGSGSKYIWDIVDDTVVALTYDKTVRAHGHRAMGTGTIYHTDGWSGGSIIKRDPVDSTSWTHILEVPGGSDWTQGAHFSLNHIDESYIFTSRHFETPATITRPYQEEIIQVFTDGSSMTNTRRLAHHRSEINGYVSYPMAASDRTGKFVLFKSNWDGSPYIDVFILKVPPLPNDTPPPPTLSADLNSDGAVNSLDWSIMNAVWNTNDTTADINNDGIVNTIDWSVMNSEWNI